MAIVKIVVAGVLIFVVFSALIGGDDPELSPRFELDRSVNDLLLRDPISASAMTEVNGTEYLFLMTKFGDDRVEPADLRIVQIDPDNELDEVGWLHTSLSVETPPSAIAVEGNHVYVGLAAEDRQRPALWVVDVSNPERPFEANLISVDMPIRGLAASDDGFLVASGYDVDFLVFDISQPDEPAELAAFSESISVAPQIVLHQDTLLLDHMAGVVMTDMSDPAQPERSGEFEHPDWVIPGIPPQAGGFLTGEERFEDAVPAGNFLDIAADGDLLAVASSDDGLVLVDISSPSSPAEVSRIEIEGRAARVAVDGEQVYVLGAQPHDGSDLRYNVYTIEVTDPASPTISDTSPDIVGVPRFQNLVTSDGQVLLLFNDSVIRFLSPD